MTNFLLGLFVGQVSMFLLIYMGYNWREHRERKGDFH
jgi:hypothetical protein